jgi:hypothetical protein
MENDRSCHCDNEFPVTIRLEVTHQEEQESTAKKVVCGAVTYFRGKKSDIEEIASAFRTYVQLKRRICGNVSANFIFESYFMNTDEQPEKSQWANSKAGELFVKTYTQTIW